MPFGFDARSFDPEAFDLDAFEVEVGAPHWVARRQYIALQLVNGAPAVGLTHNSAGLLATMTCVGEAPLALTLVTQTPTGAFTDGGFCELSSTNAPGLYRLDIPDAFGEGLAQGVVLSIAGTGLRPYHEFLPFEQPVEVEGTAVTGTLSTTACTTAGLDAYGAGQLNRRLLQWLTGPAAGERVLIVAHASDGTLQLAPPVTSAPTNGSAFRVL